MICKAKLENGVVIEACVFDDDPTYLDGWVTIPSHVTVGWIFDGDSYQPPPDYYLTQSISIRYARDTLLSETDWIVARSYEQNEPVPADWATYRQALRDITAQTGFPYNVEWPTKPN